MGNLLTVTTIDRGIQNEARNKKRASVTHGGPKGKGKG
jgi:hypothetical protein